MNYHIWNNYKIPDYLNTCLKCFNCGILKMDSKHCHLFWLMNVKDYNDSKRILEGKSYKFFYTMLENKKSTRNCKYYFAESTVDEPKCDDMLIKGIIE